MEKSSWICIVLTVCYVRIDPGLLELTALTVKPFCAPEQFFLYTERPKICTAHAYTANRFYPQFSLVYIFERKKYMNHLKHNYI